MMNGNCSCFHHWVIKVVAVLAWVAGVLFFWSGLKDMVVWGYDPLFYAWSVVVLVLLTKVSGLCGCCGRGSKMMNGKMCSHQADCRCGDCDRCK